MAIPQGIFPTQGLNPDLLQCRQILYQLGHRERANVLKARGKKGTDLSSTEVLHQSHKAEDADGCRLGGRKKAALDFHWVFHRFQGHSPWKDGRRVEKVRAPLRYTNGLRMQDQQSRPDMTENQSRLESRIDFQKLRKLGLSFKALNYLWRIADAHISSPVEKKKVLILSSKCLKPLTSCISLNLPQSLFSGNDR